MLELPNIGKAGVIGKTGYPRDNTLCSAQPLSTGNSQCRAMCGIIDVFAASITYYCSMDAMISR
jgi:hypothetical protein